MPRFKTVTVEYELSLEVTHDDVAEAVREYNENCSEKSEYKRVRDCMEDCNSTENFETWLQEEAPAFDGLEAVEYARWVVENVTEEAGWE